MVARHCVTNSKFLPEKIQMEKYQVGANVYNLDLNVALVHDWELASTWAENVGMPLLLRAACASFLFLSFSFFPAGCCCCCFLIFSWNTSLSWTGQHHSPVCLFSSLAAVALLGPVPFSWLCPPSSSPPCISPLPSPSSVVTYPGELSLICSEM